MCVRVFVLVFQCFLLYVRSCRLKKIYSSRLSKGVRALRRWIGTRPSEGALVDAFPGTFATCFELQPRSPLSTLVGLVEYVKVGQRIKADFRKQTRKKEFVIMRLVVSTNPESGSCALCPCPFVISVVNLPLLVHVITVSVTVYGLCMKFSNAHVHWTFLSSLSRGRRGDAYSLPVHVPSSLIEFLLLLLLATPFCFQELYASLCAWFLSFSTNLVFLFFFSTLETVWARPRCTPPPPPGVVCSGNTSGMAWFPGVRSGQL